MLRGTAVGGELGPLLLWICLVTIAVIYIAGALGLALGLTEGRWRRGGSARGSVLVIEPSGAEACYSAA